MTTAVVTSLATTALGYWLYSRRQRTLQRRINYPAPHTLVINPAIPATTTQLSPTTWQVKWTETTAHTDLFFAPQPNQFDWQNPLATAENSTELTVTLSQAMPRPYFALRHDDGQTVYTAVRLLPTPSVLNLRDIGGYQTQDGQQLRWGCIYRAGDLSQLSEPDLAYLQQLDFKLVCDLRTSEEVEKSPNRLLGGDTLHLHHPIYERDKGDGHWLRSIILKQGDIDDIWLHDVYLARFVEGRATAFGRVLTMMADPQNYPLLLHCTAGKDRTGISIALLLALLGVPDETIIADYTLSNLFYDQLLASVEADAKRLAVFGIQTADLFPLLTSQDKVLWATLAYIRGNYGSIEAYVQNKAGVTAVTINQLRANLLYTN